MYSKQKSIQEDTDIQESLSFCDCLIIYNSKDKSMSWQEEIMMTDKRRFFSVKHN